MVNSGSFDSDGQGDRNAKVGCTQLHNASDSTQSSSPVTASAAVATCKSGFSQTADSDLPSVAYAIEPTPTKTEFNSNMPMENVTDLSTLYESVVETDKSLVSSSSSSIEDEKTSLCCSLPLDKVQGVLTSYQSTRTDEDAVRAKPIRKLLCLYCDRSFVSANLRQKHVERIHSVKQNRRVSSRRHNQLTVTPCVYCDKLNATENTLKDLFLHLVNEHSNKYFGCLPCEDRFFTSSLLADHNAYNHPPNVQSPSNNQNETADKATLNQSQLKDVKDESTEEQEDVPVKVTRSRVKLKSEELHKSAKFKEMRSKKLTVKSSRLAFKKRESKRLQAMTKSSDSQKKKRPKPMDKKQTAVNRTEQNISTKSTEKIKSNVSCINPYPEFDNFYRVKKITDHSIDNLKISSLTFDDVFDKAFFNRIKCNIEENLLHHIDGKLFKNEESENRISNFEKVSNIPQEMLNSNPENYGCELSLNAVTPVASLSLNSQYGEDFESQIEYGSKPSKKKTQIKKDEVHYKYFTRRKYQASILEHKENRDLSKLDMWTQLVIKKRQQKMIDEKKSAKEMMEYTTGDEYKSKIRREELNRILDRRGPFEDLREEASKKAALDKLNWSSDDSISHESFTEVREVLNQILNQVFAITECSNTQSVDETIEISTFNKKQDQREIPSYLNLRRSSSLPSEGEIDKSDKIALICSSQETENYELPTNQVRGKNELIELSGEWARCRMYICAACGAKLPNMRYLLDHKSMYHQNVWVQHYEFVGNQSELYRHLSIPALGKIGKVEETVQCKLWRRSEARICTKCGKQCNSLGELHRHILECGGDWTWMLVRKKCKYRPFGAKSRRKRRGLVSRIYNKQKTEPTEKKKYKKTFDGPRQRPSDADTIQRMLANLPAKRSTRKLISFQEGIYRSRKNQQIQNLNQKKVKCGKVIYTSRNIKENPEKTINASRVSKKTQSNISSNRRSLRSFNKVLSSRILDTNTKLTVKRKLKVLNERRKTRQNRTEAEGDETTIEKFDENGSNDNINLSGSSNKSKIRNLPRDKKENVTLKRSPRLLTRNIKKISVKKLLTGKINIKSFFPVKKRKSRRALLENTDVESVNDEDSEVDEEDISTRSKRRLKEVEGETDKKVEPQPKLQTKKTKHDTLGNLVRSLSIHKSKNSKNPKPSGKQDIESEVIPENTESSTDLIVREKKSEELDKTSKKRKLKQNFKKVLNRVKRLKIDNNSSAQNSQSTIASKEGDGKKSTYVPFLDKAKPLDLPVAPQDKIIIPSTLEIKENLADISKTALIVMTHETKENPPIPETIFQLESNNEESLQAKGELNFDALPIPVSKDNNVSGTTNIEENSMTTTPKMDPISIETSFKPKVVPLISPNMKGKIRKPSRGLNDCIAMLTSKLQQKTEVVPKVKNLFNVLSPNTDIAKPCFDQTPHKTECILKIPTFKSNLTAGTEETALDLTTKKKVNEDERHEMFNPPKNQLEENLNVNMPINSVDQIIEDVVGNNFIKVPTPKSLHVWNSIDDTIQTVIDTHQDVDVPLIIRNTVDDIIDFVIASKNSDEIVNTHIKSTENEKCLEIIKTIAKSERKIGSKRKIRSKERKIVRDTSDVKVTDKKLVQDSQSDGKIPLSQAIMDITNDKINTPEISPTNPDSVTVSKEQASSNISLDISTSVTNEKDDLNNGFINITKETIEKSDKRKKMGKHFRKIGEARIKTHSRGRKKKNPILETNLDHLFHVDEINSNPGISTKNIDSGGKNCNKIKFSNEDEPHVMENKVLELQSISNTRLSDSDDDIPLAALIKVGEGNKTDTTDKITSDVCDLDETISNGGKNNGQHSSISDRSHSKDVSRSQNNKLTGVEAKGSDLAEFEKLIESNEDQQEFDVNTEVDIQPEENVDKIDLLRLSDVLLDNKIPDESEMGSVESGKSNIIDNDVLKEQTNNLTGILDVSKDEIILDKTVQIIKDEKSLKKLSKSPKSQKKRLSKNIDKLSDNNHANSNLKVFVEKESSANTQNQLVVKKKAKTIKSISDKEIFQVDSDLFDGKNNENKIENLRKSNQNSVLDLDDSSEVCSNSVTLSNVSVKSNELLNNLFETLTANTKIPDVCSLDSLQLLDPQVDPGLLPNENEKGQNILESVRNSSFSKPKTVGRKPKSKSLKKSKSTTEISKNIDNCNISSLSNNAEMMPRKITRSRSLKNMQTKEESNCVLERDILDDQISKSFGNMNEVQTNVMKKVKSASDLQVLTQDLTNERLFGDILESKHHSKKKLGRKSKTEETPVKPNDLIDSDTSHVHSINVNEDVNEEPLRDSRKKISKKLTNEKDNDILNKKNTEIEDTINNHDESVNESIENEINESKQPNYRHILSKNIGNSRETISDQQHVDKINDSKVDEEVEHLFENSETSEHDASDQINEISNSCEMICEQALDNKPVTKMRKKPGRKKKNPEKDDSREALIVNPVISEIERPKRGRKKKTVEQSSEIEPTPIDLDVSTVAEDKNVNNATNLTLENVTSNNDMDFDPRTNIFDTDVQEGNLQNNTISDTSTNNKEAKSPGSNYSNSEKCLESYQIKSITTDTYTLDSANSTGISYDLMKSNKLKIILNKTKIFIEPFGDVEERVDRFPNLPLENTSTPKNKLLDNTSTKLDSIDQKFRTQKTAKSKDTSNDLFLDFDVNASDSTEDHASDVNEKLDTIIQAANTMDSVQFQPDSNTLITKRPRGRPAKKKDSIVVSKINNLHNTSEKLGNLIDYNILYESEEILSDPNCFRTNRMRSKGTKKNDLTSLDDISALLENNIDNNITNELIENELDSNRRTRIKISRKNDSIEPSSTDNAGDISSVYDDSTDDTVSKGFNETRSNSSDSRNIRPRARKNYITDGSSTDNSYDISVKLDDSTDDNVTKELPEIGSNSGGTRIIRPRSRSARKNDSTKGTTADISDDVSVDFNYSTDDNFTKDLVEIQSGSNDLRIKRQRGRPAKKNDSTEGNCASILSDTSIVFKDDSYDNVSQGGSNVVTIKRHRGRPPKRIDLTEGKNANISDDISASLNDGTCNMINTHSEIQSDSNDSRIRKLGGRSSINNDLPEASGVDISDGCSVLVQSNTDDNITTELVETQSDSNESRIRRPRGRPSRKKDPSEIGSSNISYDNPIIFQDSTDGNVTKQFVEPPLKSNDLKIRRPRGRPAKKQDQTESTTNISDVISVPSEDNVDHNVINEFEKMQSVVAEMSNATNEISLQFKDSINDNTNESIGIQPDSNVPRNRRTRSSSTKRNDLTELSSAYSMDDVSVELEHNSGIFVTKEPVVIQSEENVSRKTRPRSTRENDLPEASSANVSDDIPQASEIIQHDHITEESAVIRAVSRNKRTRSRSARNYDDVTEPNSANNTLDVSVEYESSTDVTDGPRHRRAKATSGRKSNRTELSDTNVSVTIQGDFDDNMTKEFEEIHSDSLDSKSRRGRSRFSRKNDLLEANNVNVPVDISGECDDTIVAVSSISRNRRTRSTSARKNDLAELDSANSVGEISAQIDHNVTREVVEIESNSNDLRVRNIVPSSIKKDNSSQEILMGLENGAEDDFTKNYSGIDSDTNDLGAKSMRKDPIVATTVKSPEAIALELETVVDNNQSDSNDSGRTRPTSGTKDLMRVSHVNTLEDVSLELVNIDNVTNESLSKQSDSNTLMNRRNRSRSGRKNLIELSSENISDGPCVELETRDQSEIIQPKSRKLASRRSRSLKLKKDNAFLKDNTSTTSDMDMSQTNAKGSNRRAMSLTNTRDKNIDSTETVLDKTDSEIAIYLTNDIDENPEKVLLQEIPKRKTGEENEVKRSRSSRNKPVINYSENDDVDKRDTSDDVIVPNLEKQDHFKSTETVDSKKTINKRPRTNKTKKSSNLNAKLNGTIADEFNDSTEDNTSNANASNIKLSECKDPVILNVGNIETNNEYVPKDIEIAQVPPIIENSGSLTVKKTDEPPIKIIINKHKTRRKSKSFRKVDSKGQNDLFEDFALVIKKPKGTAPIITFSPADTFSKDTYPNYITKTVEAIAPKYIPMVDEQIPEEQTDVSVEEMDMELDELPITSGIIENTSVSLSLPVETPPLINISIEDDVSDKLDNFTTVTHSKKNKKKKVAKNKKNPKPSVELPLESASLDIDLSVSIESQEQELPGVIEIQNSESVVLCQLSQSPSAISDNPKVSINTPSELMQSEVNEDDIYSEQVKTTKKPKRPSRSKKANIDSSISEVDESVNVEDKEYFNETLHLKDKSLAKDLSDVAPALSDTVTKTIEKVADEIYAFTEIEDLEIEKPLEIPKRLPRKQTKSFTEIDTTKETVEVENSQLETLAATSCEENSMKLLKRKQKSVVEEADTSENSINKTINSSALEEPQDTGRRPVRTAKVKALEHIHDDALADLTDTEKTNDSRKVQPIEENKPGILTKKHKKPQPSDDTDPISSLTKKPKRHKKNQKIPPIVDPIDILEEKTPSLADLVADLEGLEELENSIERELNAGIDDKDITDLNQEVGENDLNTPHDEPTNKALDNEENPELRRSRRGSRKLGSYNENELLEPLLDAIGAKRKVRKKEAVDKNQVSNEQAKKLNSDELFDLLKASTNDTSISKTQLFLNSIDDSSTTLNETSNLNNMFENILEKSSLLVQSNLNKQQEQNDIAKVYEFSEQSELEIKEKVCQKNSHKKRNISPEKIQIFEPSDSGASYSSFAQDTEEPNTEVHSKSKKSKKRESNFCEICNKSFIRLENLIKHKRTLTHIQKLSEIEAKQALEKSSLEQKHVESETPDPSVDIIPDLQENLEHSKIDININDILLDSEKPTENHSPVVHSSFTNSHSLKLADIINDVLNKPHLENDINDEHNKFSDIIIANNTDIRPEYKRYKSLGERKSFDSDKIVPVDNQSVSVKEPYVSKTTILEKQISLLENIIENQTGISYIDDISMSSNRSNSELSIKQDDSSNLTSKNGRKPSNNDDSFLKPTQYEEISEDSANLKSYEDQKLRKTLNRDEELFLECCSLLKSGSEVSSYSNKRAQNKIKLNNACTGQLEKPDWQERGALQKPELSVMQEYSDDNSRIPTPLGESYADDESNSNTISSNWEIKEQEAETQNDLQKSGNTSFNLDKVLNCEKKTELEDIQIDSKTTSSGDLDKEKPERSANIDAKKIVTKGARKVFEGLKVSIPTEDLNMEQVLNSSPKAKKNELESVPIIITPNMNKLGDSESLQQTRPSRTARKSKPVKKSQVGSNLLFKVNKKKVPSPNTTPAKTQSQEIEEKRNSYDVYDFEETQDNSDIFTKPDFRAFRNMKSGEIVDPESDTESRDYLDPISLERESITSTSVSSHSSFKKPKAQENITKKKCMIMGRIFKNAAKSKIEDIDEEIRSIPTIDNEELVETYVASCKRVIKNEAKPKLSEKEINQLFDQLLGDKNIEKDTTLTSTVAKTITKSKPECKKLNESKKKTKVKNRKRVRTNSDSTDDEFQLNNISKRAYRKNAKSDDNCINLEQELKECIGVASRKSQRKCTSGKQNVLVEYWSSDESQFEALLETQRIETIPTNKNPSELENIADVAPKEVPAVDNVEIKKVTEENVDKTSKPKNIQRKSQHKKKSNVDKKEKSYTPVDKVKTLDTVTTNRRKRAAANPLYHWSSSSEDESQDLIEVKPLRDEIEDDEERPIQHGWIVGDSPKKLVTMLAQAKGKKTDIDCVKEQGKKRTNAVS